MPSHPARDAWIEISPSSPNGRKCFQSHPARDAWIEIGRLVSLADLPSCRIPHGMRGLKCRGIERLNRSPRRIPHGMRGLKWAKGQPSRCFPSCRIPHGMRGLKSAAETPDFHMGTSHPARDAWIEIIFAKLVCSRTTVASRTGCVD